ncbi:MAG: hypothetical protein ACKO47_05945 [Alphaproteobacteria bacterium]
MALDEDGPEIFLKKINDKMAKIESCHTSLKTFSIAGGYIFGNVCIT